MGELGVVEAVETESVSITVRLFIQIQDGKGWRHSLNKSRAKGRAG